MSVSRYHDTAPSFCSQWQTKQCHGSIFPLGKSTFCLDNPLKIDDFETEIVNLFTTILQWQLVKLKFQISVQIMLLKLMHAFFAWHVLQIWVSLPEHITNNSPIHSVSVLLKPSHAQLNAFILGKCHCSHHLWLAIPILTWVIKACERSDGVVVVGGDESHFCQYSQINSKLPT